MNDENEKLSWKTIAKSCLYFVIIPLIFLAVLGYIFWTSPLIQSPVK